jgi:hypothetical protein
MSIQAQNVPFKHHTRDMNYEGATGYQKLVQQASYKYHVLPKGITIRHKTFTIKHMKETKLPFQRSSPLRLRELSFVLVPLPFRPGVQLDPGLLLTPLSSSGTGL